MNLGAFDWTVQISVEEFRSIQNLMVEKITFPWEDGQRNADILVSSYFLNNITSESQLDPSLPKGLQFQSVSFDYQCLSVSMLTNNEDIYIYYMICSCQFLHYTWVVNYQWGYLSMVIYYPWLYIYIYQWPWMDMFLYQFSVSQGLALVLQPRLRRKCISSDAISLLRDRSASFPWGGVGFYGSKKQNGARCGWWV